MTAFILDFKGMKRRLILPLLLWTILSSATALGDGRIYVRERVPVDIPYQRAFIMYSGGRETLLVQSRYAVDGATGMGDLGWVVPVPAVPEIGSMDAGAASHLFSGLSLAAQPRITSLWRDGLPLLVGVIGIGSFLVLIGCLLPSTGLRSRTRGVRAALAGATLAVVCMLLPSTAASRARVGDVEVIREQRVGIYDVQVVAAGSATGLVSWLSGNGFQYGVADERAIRSYIEKGWCFVTASVQPERAARPAESLSEGLVAPLVLQFPVESPVYPMALTSAGSSETEVLLYVVSDSPVSCDDRLKLFYSDAPGWGWGMAREALRVVSPTGMCFSADKKWHFIAKLKGRMTAAQMREDIVFRHATDWKPFRAHVFTW